MDAGRVPWEPPFFPAPCPGSPPPQSPLWNPFFLPSPPVWGLPQCVLSSPVFFYMFSCDDLTDCEGLSPAPTFLRDSSVDILSQSEPHCQGPLFPPTRSPSVNGQKRSQHRGCSKPSLGGRGRLLEERALELSRDKLG